MKNQSSWRTVDGTAMPAKRQASERARVGGEAARAVDEAEREAEREAGEEVEAEAEVEARGVTEAAESAPGGSSSSSSCFESAVRRTAYLTDLAFCFADLPDICGGGGGGRRYAWWSTPGGVCVVTKRAYDLYSVCDGARVWPWPLAGFCHRRHSQRSARRGSTEAATKAAAAILGRAPRQVRAPGTCDWQFCGQLWAAQRS